MDLIFTINTHQRSVSTDSSYIGLMERIRCIGESGYNCIRINLKQFNEQECDKTYTILNAIEEVKSFFPYPIKVFIDIPYPYQKYRIKLSEKKIELKKGEVLILRSNEHSDLNKHEIFINSEFLDGICEGCEITYGDGIGILKVIQVAEQYAKVVVLDDFEMFTGKSLNCGHLMRQHVSAQFVEFLSSLHKMDIVEAFLFSFCGSGSDKEALTSYFKNIPSKKYYAKVESNEGIKNIDSIIDSFDGIVIARGDLANTCGTKNFYTLHNYLAHKGMESSKKLIFATDIMMSLENNSYLSRADLIDMSNMLCFNPDALILNSNLAYKLRGGFVSIS